MTSPIEVLTLAVSVRRACETASEAKQLLKVAGRKMDTLLPVLSKIQSCGEAVALNADMQRVLEELAIEIQQTMKLATKAKTMSRVVFVVRAPQLRERFEVNFKAIQLSIMALQAMRNEQLGLELRTFHCEWKKREAELRNEAERERDEQVALDQDLRAQILTGGRGRIKELETALAEIRLERDEVEAVLLSARDSADSVASDKARAEALFIDQFIWLLERLEASERQNQQQQSKNELPEDCYCPISNEVMRDPVIVHAVCAHTVSRMAFQSWMDTGSSNCPVCGTVLTSRHSSPNAPLRAMIEALEVMQAEREAELEAKREQNIRMARKCPKREEKRIPQEKQVCVGDREESDQDFSLSEVGSLKDCNIHEQKNQPKKKFLVLTSSCLVDRKQALNQRRGLDLLRAKEISFETLDGGDPDLRMRRNALFKISGVRANYPQFFLVDEHNSTTYFGDWNKLEAINEASTMPWDVLQANPQIETWDSVLG